MGPKPKDVKLRLLSKIDTSGPSFDGSPCWIWIAGCNSGGYGAIKVKGRQKGAHRVAYETFIGPIPEDHQVHHRCEKQSCINPSHLQAIVVRKHLLISRTFQAANAAKTHCPQGHVYDESNTRMRSGARTCRKCASSNAAKYKQSRPEKVAQYNRNRVNTAERRAAYNARQRDRYLKKIAKRVAAEACEAP